jgi:BspA type Leucine rich repeat region (6 copies)
MNRTVVSLVIGINSLILLNARAQFGYEINPGGKTVTITNYSGPPDVVIPTNIAGLAVTSIGAYSFPEDDVTSVWIPFGVANIGDFAFASCSGLTNVAIPSSVSTIGSQAFSDTEITSVVIPNSVIDMGENAFSGCEYLTNLTISYGIDNLESDFFSECSSLPSVMIPASVTNIGTYAFTGDIDLKAVFFAGNAPAVDNTAFILQTFYGFGNHSFSNYYAATAYYLPGTTGWEQFMSNTLTYATDGGPVDVFVPTVLWNPTIAAAGTNFGVQNGQYGFDITATTNLPIAIEACDDLSQSNWTVIQRLTITNGLYHFSEPYQSNTPARFYRIGFP